MKKKPRNITEDDISIILDQVIQNKNTMIKDYLIGRSLFVAYDEPMPPQDQEDDEDNNIIPNEIQQEEEIEVNNNDDDNDVLMDDPPMKTPQNIAVAVNDDDDEEPENQVIKEAKPETLKEMILNMSPTYLYGLLGLLLLLIFISCTALVMRKRSKKQQK